MHAACIVFRGCWLAGPGRRPVPWTARLPAIAAPLRPPRSRRSPRSCTPQHQLGVPDRRAVQLRRRQSLDQVLLRLRIEGCQNIAKAIPRRHWSIPNRSGRLQAADRVRQHAVALRHEPERQAHDRRRIRRLDEGARRARGSRRARHRLPCRPPPPKHRLRPSRRTRSKPPGRSTMTTRRPPAATASRPRRPERRASARNRHPHHRRSKRHADRTAPWPGARAVQGRAVLAHRSRALDRRRPGHGRRPCHQRPRISDHRRSPSRRASMVSRWMRPSACT